MLAAPISRNSHKRAAVASCSWEVAGGVFDGLKTEKLRRFITSRSHGGHGTRVCSMLTTGQLEALEAAFPNPKVGISEYQTVYRHTNTEIKV